MNPKESNSITDAVRRPARDIIDAVLENMRKNVEPLRYSALVPSRYTVYLHPAEYARLEGIIAILQQQTIRALTEAVDARNRGSFLTRYAERILGSRNPRVENPGGEWSVEFLPDPDGDIPEGDILVDSELMWSGGPDPGAGERTRLITMFRAGQRTTTRKQTHRQSPDAWSFAKILYDDTTGHHSYAVTKDSVTIGRGGIAYPVDIRIASSADVSREHARIRRDSRSGDFFLVDLSTLGTTLNGRHVPRGYDDVNGTRRENGAETLIPDQARIGLADTVYLHFGLVRR
jgi:hypothetical protein